MDIIKQAGQSVEKQAQIWQQAKHSPALALPESASFHEDQFLSTRFNLSQLQST